MSEEIKEEFWNYICWDCKWRGVAQGLEKDETLEEFYCCPQCSSENFEDVGWHLGDKKYTGK